MLKLKIAFLTVCILLISVCAEAARPRKKEVKKIERLLVNRNFDEAEELLREGIKEYPDYADYNFMMGVCFYHNHNGSPEGIDYLERALSNTRKRKLIIEIKHYLGKTYHCNKMFNEAIAVYKSLNEDIAPRNEKFRKEIKRLIESSEYARRVCEKPVNIKIVSLGDNINTKYVEHSPSLSADERFLVFTSRRGEYNEVKDVDGQYFEDVYSAYFDGDKWTDPKLVEELASLGHDASVSLSNDGRTLLLYRAEADPYSEVSGDIYISYRTGDKWSMPVKLQGGINSEYRESHAVFSRDGRTIYFASNRPGGQGGMDIYSSVKDENGNWQKPKNLGDVINTEYDELGPFFHADDKTLFFSSKGHKTIGGFDFFSSEKTENGWTKPKNLGYPINSLLDDIYYTPTVDGKRAYFASARPGGRGKLDLYVMKIEDLNANKIFVMRGVLGRREAEESFEDYRIIVRNSKGEEEGVYSPDPTTGEYLYIISADKDYNIEFARKGYQTLYTEVNIPYAYYNDYNHGVMTFNKINLLKYEGGYIPPDFSLNLDETGYRSAANVLPVIEGQKAKLIIKNLGRRREIPKGQDIRLGATTPIAVPIVKREIKKEEKEYITIQVKAMKKFLPLSFFDNYGYEVKCIKCKDGLYRYITGEFTDPKEAGRLLRKIRKSKIGDEFIRVIKGNKPGRIVPYREWK